MTKRQKRRIIIAILIILLSIITVERIYNSREVFQVSAKDASYYGILEANLTTREKLEDFEYLYNVLEENFPFFNINKRLHGIDWLGNKSKYKRIIRNTKNDAEFFVALDRILNDLYDGHTNIFDGKSFRRFFRSYYYHSSRFPFWDDVFFNPYVMNRYNFSGDIESVEDMELYKGPVLETKILLEDEVAYMKIKAMASDARIVKEDYDKAKEFLKEVEDYEKLIIDIRGNGGGWDLYWQSIVGLLIDEPLAMRYYSFFKDGHRYKYDPYYVRYLTAIEELDKEILNQLSEEVKTDFKYYKSYYYYVKPAVYANPSEHIDFSGKVYLLVDRNVFSSAEKFASFSKDTGFATLVGEPTGGGKVFEWIPIIYLPNSKFAIRYSRELVLNADGTINMETNVIPHIMVEDPTYHGDFTKDECIQVVIKDRKDMK